MLSIGPVKTPPTRPSVKVRYSHWPCRTGCDCGAVPPTEVSHSAQNLSSSRSSCPQLVQCFAIAVVPPTLQMTHSLDSDVHTPERRACQRRKGARQLVVVHTVLVNVCVCPHGRTLAPQVSRRSDRHRLHAHRLLELHGVWWNDEVDQSTLAGEMRCRRMSRLSP